MSDTIKVLLIKPMKPPEVTEIPNTLESMKALVGGWIEAVYPFEDRIALVGNDAAKLEGLPLNRALRDNEGKIYDIMAGDFFVCDATGENFASLSDEQIKKYSEKFKTPELFVSINGQIAAIPLMTSHKPRNNDAR